MKGQTMVFNGLQFLPIGSRKHDVAIEAHGYYRSGPNGVHLYKPDGSLEAYIVNNQRQGRFVVSASSHQGAPRYMYSTSTLTENWLNMQGMGRMAEDDAIRAIQFH